MTVQTTQTKVTTYLRNSSITVSVLLGQPRVDFFWCCCLIAASIKRNETCTVSTTVTEENKQLPTRYICLCETKYYFIPDELSDWTRIAHCLGKMPIIIEHT